MNLKINLKKLFILIGFLIIVALIAFLLYKMFFTKQTSTIIPNQTTPQTETNLELPLAKEGGLQKGENTTPENLPTSPEYNAGNTEQPEQVLEQTAKRENKIVNLLNDNIESPSLSADGSSLRYYNPNTEKFYKTNLDGTTTPLLDKKFYKVQKVVWAPQQDKAILEYPDGSKALFNFETKKLVSLPKHWEDFSWSQKGNEIAFKSIGYDVENRWLAVMNGDGSGSHTVEKIGQNADKIITSWSPNNQMIAMMTEGLDLDRKTVYFIGLHGENFRSLVTEGRGFAFRWAPQGDKLLYSVYSAMSDYKPMLWISDASGDNIGNNNVPLNVQTWANKCTFSKQENNIIYCAIPKNLPEGAGMFPQLADQSSDELYRIDTTKGTKTFIADTGFLNMTNLILTKDENHLYFTDKLTGLLHKIDF